MYVQGLEFSLVKEMSSNIYGDQTEGKENPKCGESIEVSRRKKIQKLSGDRLILEKAPVCAGGDAIMFMLVTLRVLKVPYL
ncbi:unnamed protein product [Lactuca virosa]|uniref:Uncharacterized protein n=1 Tax=Lactuca virosa TaxID=75947 RepID=A0AAU9PAS9_9ASTR|nr:unnamed protein product [Lactuca virosa]